MADGVIAVAGEQDKLISSPAAHAVFKEKASESFLLAYDGQITMDKLEEYVGLFRFRDVPLDLLTLSACETAQGDDQAALGLTGIAIKAGARSAVGTLWKIKDAPAEKLVGDFYRRLLVPGTSRAVALQGAQRALLADRSTRHPNYWAAFVLIGSWI